MEGDVEEAVEPAVASEASRLSPPSPRPMSAVVAEAIEAAMEASWAARAAACVVAYPEGGAAPATLKTSLRIWISDSRSRSRPPTEPH